MNFHAKDKQFKGVKLIKIVEFKDKKLILVTVCNRCYRSRHYVKTCLYKLKGKVTSDLLWSANLCIMHIQALAALLLIGLAVADKQFSHFQNKFAKKYSPKELLARQAIFQANVKAIAEHNEKFARGETSYQKQIDEFTDMTREEMAAQINGN